MGALGTRLMAIMIRGRAHVGFFPHAEFVCPRHLLHFMVHFLLRVTELCFLLFF